MKKKKSWKKKLKKFWFFFFFFSNFLDSFSIIIVLLKVRRPGRKKSGFRTARTLKICRTSEPDVMSGRALQIRINRCAKKTKLDQIGINRCVKNWLPLSVVFLTLIIGKRGLCLHRLNMFKLIIAKSLAKSRANYGSTALVRAPINLSDSKTKIFLKFLNGL